MLLVQRARAATLEFLTGQTEDSHGDIDSMSDIDSMASSSAGEGSGHEGEDEGTKTIREWREWVEEQGPPGWVEHGRFALGSPRIGRNVLSHVFEHIVSRAQKHDAKTSWWVWFAVVI